MKIRIKHLALTATLASLSAAGRVLLTPVPNVAPNAFLAILGGILMGPLYGFLVGSLGMLVSDFYVGAGFWTVGTALFMGVIGGLAGLFWNRRIGEIPKLELAVGGYLLTLLYDVASSLWWIPIVMPDASLAHYGVFGILGLFFPVMAGQIPWPFGVIHEASTAIFLSQIEPLVVGQFGHMLDLEVAKPG